MTTLSIWEGRATIQNCWVKCDTFPGTSHLSNEELLYIKEYRDNTTRGEWNDHVLFFSCLKECRYADRERRATTVLIPVLVAIAVLLILLCCVLCKGCPLYWCCSRRSSRKHKVAPKGYKDSPILVSTVYSGDYGGVPATPSMNSTLGRRRESTLVRKMHNLEHTAPAPAQYDPIGLTNQIAMGWLESVQPNSTSFRHPHSVSPIIEEMEDDLDATSAGSKRHKKRKKKRSSGSSDRTRLSLTGDGGRQTSSRGSVKVARY